MVNAPSPPLKEQFESKLNVPVGARSRSRTTDGTCDLIECAPAKREVWVAVVRMIEEIEQFRTELQPESLRESECA